MVPPGNQPRDSRRYALFTLSLTYPCFGSNDLGPEWKKDRYVVSHRHERIVVDGCVYQWYPNTWIERMWPPEEAYWKTFWKNNCTAHYPGGTYRSQSDCAICLRRLHRRRPTERPSCCLHTYCEACIREWQEYSDTCPTCRERMVEVIPVGFAFQNNLRGRGHPQSSHHQRR
jgi:hypothetical protein